MWLIPASSTSPSPLPPTAREMSLPVIFSSSDVQEIVAANKKIVMAKKQKNLQDWGVDGLMEKILDPLASRHSEIKDQLMAGNSDVLIWSGPQLYFKRHSTEPDMDCRSEKYEDSVDTVEEVVIMNGLHEVVKSRNHWGTSGYSVYSILRYTDFKFLLAARFGSHFTVSWDMLRKDGENQYWTPYIISIYLKFWPKGVPQEMAEQKAAAIAAWDYRQKNLIVEHCEHCDRGIPRATLVKGSVYTIRGTNFKEYSYYCSMECRSFDHELSNE